MWRLEASWAEGISEPSLQGPGEGAWASADGGGALPGLPDLAWQGAGSCLPEGLRHTSSPHSNPFPLQSRAGAAHSDYTVTNRRCHPMAGLVSCSFCPHPLQPF